MREVWDAASGLLMSGVAAIPLWMVRAIIILAFLALAGWAMTMPRAYAFKGAPREAWYYDVRLWAVAVIACEILPYLFF